MTRRTASDRCPSRSPAKGGGTDWTGWGSRSLISSTNRLRLSTTWPCARTSKKYLSKTDNPCTTRKLGLRVKAAVHGRGLLPGDEDCLEEGGGGVEGDAFGVPGGQSTYVEQ